MHKFVKYYKINEKLKSLKIQVKAFLKDEKYKSEISLSIF